MLMNGKIIKLQNIKIICDKFKTISAYREKIKEQVKEMEKEIKEANIQGMEIFQWIKIIILKLFLFFLMRLNFLFPRRGNNQFKKNLSEKLLVQVKQTFTTYQNLF